MTSNIQSQKTIEALNSPQTAETVRTQTFNKVKVTCIALVVILMVNGVVVLISGVQSKKITTYNQQIVATRASSVALEAAVGFLQSQEPVISKINAALPNESTVVDFIQTVENLSDLHARSKDLQLSPLPPSSPAAQKAIPFVLKLTTDKDNFYQFLSKLEKLPFLIEITSITSSSENLPKNVMDFAVSAKVYVQDPFSQSQLQINIPTP